MEEEKMGEREVGEREISGEIGREEKEGERKGDIKRD